MVLYKHVQFTQSLTTRVSAQSHHTLQRLYFVYMYYMYIKNILDCIEYKVVDLLDPVYIMMLLYFEVIMQRLSIFSRADRGGSIYYMYRETLKSSPLTINNTIIIVASR